MPNTREKLIELLKNSPYLDVLGGLSYYEEAADHLIANGVTVQELDGCIRCKDSQKMTVTISNKLVDGVNTGWLGGNSPARFCPFCGRRLPQPPKRE